MILLDTNVLSALMHDPPDIAAVAWMDKQNAQDVWTSTVTVFEVRFGLARMAAGRKRAALEAAFDGLLREDLGGRIALFDRAAAEAAGQLAARREAAGRPVDVRDTLIAGIALSRRAFVASRNVKHFDDLDTGVIDPWAA
jgi:toxin FitB